MIEALRKPGLPLLPLLFHVLAEVVDSVTLGRKYLSLGHLVQEEDLAKIPLACPNLGSCHRGSYVSRTEAGGGSLSSGLLKNAIDVEGIIAAFSDSNKKLKRESEIISKDVQSSEKKSKLLQKEVRECEDKIQGAFEESPQMKSIRRLKGPLKEAVLESLQLSR